MYRPVSSATASTTFMRGPPSTMIRRCQRGLAWKPRGSFALSSPGSSPAIFTKPPRKNTAETPQSVSPLREMYRCRPRPKVKVSTRTSKKRAAQKEAESFHADIEKARCPEVSQLVDEDHHADQDQE